jgi:hypothetical protein
MIQIVTYKLKNSIERLTNAERLNFYYDEIVEPLGASLPEIFLISRIYNILKALLKQEEYLADCQKKHSTAYMRRICNLKNEKYTLKETRINVDNAFNTLIMAINTAYIINNGDANDTKQQKRLTAAINLINSAPLRRHSSFARRMNTGLQEIAG